MQVTQAEASLLTCLMRLSSVSTWTNTKDCSSRYAAVDYQHWTWLSRSQNLALS